MCDFMVIKTFLGNVSVFRGRLITAVWSFTFFSAKIYGSRFIAVYDVLPFMILLVFV